MNAQIVKLFGVVLVLYALLLGFTSYWSIFDAEGLEENVANRRPLLEEQRIKRGEILAADGSGDRPLGPAGARAATRSSSATTRRATSTATRSATASSSAAGSASSSRTTTSWSATRPSSSRSSTSSAARPGGLQRAVGARPRGASGPRIDALGGQNGSVVALGPSDRRGAGDGQRPDLRPERRRAERLRGS